MTPRGTTVAATLTLTGLLLTGCGGSDDDDSHWTAEDVQADISRGVASDLGVDPDSVKVACPEGLDPAASEPVEMECTATVASTSYKVEVVADETDGEKVAFRWRLVNPAEHS